MALSASSILLGFCEDGFGTSLCLARKTASLKAALWLRPSGSHIGACMEITQLSCWSTGCRPTFAVWFQRLRVGSEQGNCEGSQVMLMLLLCKPHLGRAAALDKFPASWLSKSKAAKQKWDFIVLCPAATFVSFWLLPGWISVWNGHGHSGCCMDLFLIVCSCGSCVRSSVMHGSGIMISVMVTWAWFLKQGHLGDHCYSFLLPETGKQADLRHLACKMHIN